MNPLTNSTSPLNPNTSVTELAKFLEKEASKDKEVWFPTGYLSYPRLISNLEKYLTKKAGEYLSEDRVKRLWIKTAVSRETGQINVEITERQPRIPWCWEKRLALRPCSEIVIWIGRIS